jgi:hypothetical protein
MIALTLALTVTAPDFSAPPDTAMLTYESGVLVAADWLQWRGAHLHSYVVGHDAWIGGTITRSSNPAAVGQGLGILFRVQDNGEGGASAPDMTSQLVWGAVPSCNTTPPLFLIEWTNGNVQVK